MKYPLIFLATVFFLSSPHAVFANELSVTATVPAICGNGQIENGEQCDDGNTINGDSCSSSCQNITGSPIPVTPTPSNPAPAAPVAPTTPAPAPAPTDQPTDSPPAPAGDPSPTPSQPTPTPNSPSTPSNPSIPNQPTGANGGGGGDNGASNPGVSGAGSPVVTSTATPVSSTNTSTGFGSEGVSTTENIPVSDYSVSPSTTTDRLTPVIATLAGVGKKLQAAVSSIKTSLRTPGPSIEQRAQALVETAKDTVAAVEEFVNDPEVEIITKEVIMPSTVVVSAAVAAPSVAGIFWPLLRFVFLQPTLLFRRRKRTSWGVVYNSLNKMPIDLAIVRLVSTVTGRVVSSHVTDASGRYFLISQPGDYRLEVVRSGYGYPTSLLAQAADDGTMLDIYHGEVIRVTATDTNVTPNIPVDPQGEHQTPERILRQRRWRVAQHFLALAGVLITGLSLLIAFSLYTVMWFCIQILLYIITLVYIKPRRPAGWGMVSDAVTQAPLTHAVARLFSRQFNKLVATEITDAAGRYAFLVGPSEYYVTVEKTGYTPETRSVVVATPEAGLITEKIILSQPKNNIQDE